MRKQVFRFFGLLLCSIMLFGIKTNAQEEVNVEKQSDLDEKSETLYVVNVDELSDEEKEIISKSSNITDIIIEDEEKLEQFNKEKGENIKELLKDIFNLSPGNVIESIKNVSELSKKESDITSEKEIKLEHAKSYEYTNAVYILDKKNVDANIDLVKGCKVVCLGDSITQGRIDGDGRHNSYCDYLVELGLNAINLGVGGTTIGAYQDDSFFDRLGLIPDDSDYLIILGGANDYFIGNYAEFPYYVDRLFNYVAEHYTNTKIYVILPYNMYDSINTNYFGGGQDYQYYIDVMRKAAVKYDLNIIDLYEENFMSSMEDGVKENYVPDNVHTNDDGSKCLAYHIVSRFIDDLKK